MKRIRSLSTCPKLLGIYLNELASSKEEHNYSVFRVRCPSGYKELQALLANAQHGLCAYCEIRISKDVKSVLPCQVEHYFPKSAAIKNHLDYTNMIACCHGGDNPQYVRPAMPEFRGLVQNPPPPIDETKSCGAKKGDLSPVAPGSVVLDPRAVKLTATGSIPRLVKTQIDPVKGEVLLEEDTEGCQQVELPLGIVRETIQTLNLNSSRLRRNRWLEIEQMGNSLIAIREAGLELEIDDVALRLQPDSDTGVLVRYWSSIRCYFGELAEIWLETEKAKLALC